MICRKCGEPVYHCIFDGVTLLVHDDPKTDDDHEAEL